MIGTKHFEPIITGLLYGQKPKFYHAPESEVWWFIPDHGCWAFAVLSSECPINPSLLTEVSGMKDLLKSYDNTDETCEFKPTGVTRDFVEAKCTEMANTAGITCLIQKAYLQLFPDKKYRYFQPPNGPRSPIFCIEKDTSILEGIILPYISCQNRNEKGETKNV